MAAGPTPPVTESPAPHLSRASFGVALAITLAVFFLLHPVWRPLDMAAMDRNIVWSYAIIPVLVLVLLAVERKLRWSTWLLETLRLTCVKFVITFLYANLMWLFVAPPPRPTPVEAGSPATAVPGRFEVHEPPAPSALDPARTGRIEGLVLDAARQPRVGALVVVSAGLEGLVFAPPAEPLVLEHDGPGILPRLSVLQVHAPLVLRGTTAALHTIAALDAHGQKLFNVPVTAGTERRLMFDQPLGRLALTCTVAGHAELASVVLVVSHPFSAWTGADGRFVLSGVPAGELELSVELPGQEPQVLPVSLQPGAVVELPITAP